MDNFDESQFHCADIAMNRTNISVNPFPYIDCFFGGQSQNLSTSITITGKF